MFTAIPELSYLKTSMFDVFSQLHTVVEGGQQIFTKAGADVTVMQMFLHQRLVLQTLSDVSNDHLNKSLCYDKPCDINRNTVFFLLT